MRALSDAPASTEAGDERPSRTRLRWLLLWLLLALQIPALLLLAASAWLLVEREREAMVQRATQEMASLAQRTNAQVVAVQGALQRLARQLPPEGQDLGGFHQAAAALARDLEVDAIVLVRADGEPLVNTLFAAGAEPPRAVPPAFTEIARTGRADVVDVSTWPERDHPVVGIGVPVTRRGGDTLALQAVLELPRLGPLLAARPLPDRWHAAIVDGKGRYAAYAPPQAGHAGERIDPALSEQLARAGTGRFTSAEGEAGPMSVSYWTSPLTHWTVAVGAPRDAMDAVAWRSMLAFGWPMALVVAAGLAGALLVRRRLTRALGELREATEQAQASLLAANREEADTGLRFERTLLKEMDSRQAHIAHELHDAVGSAVAGVSLLLEAASTQRGDPALVGALLAKAREQVQVIADRLRQLSRGILPAGGEAGALQQALEQYMLDSAALLGVECTLRARGDFSDIGAQSAGHAYRIVQEALTNAVRHGQARRVSVRLARAGAHCGLTVRDDGKGCDLSLVQPSHPGMGLKSMQARARALQGRLSLRNRRSGGCEVVLRWSEPPAKP